MNRIVSTKTTQTKIVIWRSLYTDIAMGKNQDSTILVDRVTKKTILKILRARIMSFLLLVILFN